MDTVRALFQDALAALAALGAVLAAALLLVWLVLAWRNRRVRRQYRQAAVADAIEVVDRRGSPDDDPATEPLPVFGAPDL